MSPFCPGRRERVGEHPASLDGSVLEEATHFSDDLPLARIQVYGKGDWEVQFSLGNLGFRNQLVILAVIHIIFFCILITQELCNVSGTKSSRSLKEVKGRKLSKVHLSFIKVVSFSRS